MFAKIIQNLTYIIIFLLVVGLSTIKQLYKEHVSSHGIESNESYAHYKNKMVFLDENGKKVFGFFLANHSILDHIKMAVFDFNKNFPNIINLTLENDLGSMIFGFERNSVTFTLYTRNLTHGIYLKNINDLPKNFNYTKKTTFCTHGWLNSKKSPTCQIIKKRLLNHTDVNIFIMDWSSTAKIPTYPVAAAATKVIAVYYADFLNDIIEQAGVELHNMHLIGHSLGAHVTGFAARRIRKGKVSRITGLDPALPSFNISPDDHLNTNDSEFVDIIHTCGGFLGIKEPIGHVDFYPNGGGPPQPGCESDWQIMESCSHSKSYYLYADSIIRKQRYIATTNGPNYTCHIIPMGHHTPRHARGIYFLQTK